MNNRALTEEEILLEYKANVNNSKRVLQLMKMKNAPSQLFDAVATKDPLVFFDISRPQWKNIKYARRSPKLSNDVVSHYIDWAVESSQAIYVLADFFFNPNITSDMLRRVIDRTENSDKTSRDGGSIFLEDPLKEDPKTVANRALAMEITKENNLRYIAHHKNLPSDLLERALSSRFALTRASAAMSPNLTLTQINRLLKDKSPAVRCEIVRNRIVQRDTLLKLLDPLPEGKKRLGGEFRVIQTLIKRLPNMEDKLRALDYLASFNNGQGTRVLIAKLSKDKEEIARRAVDASRTVRRTAVKNPEALPEHKVAAALMGDSNRNVTMVRKH